MRNFELKLIFGAILLIVGYAIAFSDSGGRPGTQGPFFLAGVVLILVGGGIILSAFFM
jgi:hypothetical protein